jgi:hypothetical protein
MNEIKNLHLESFYLQGARDLLLRLQNDYEMYLIPSVKCKCNAKFSGDNSYEYFPLNNANARKLVGKGLMNDVLQERESLVRFLSGDYNGLQQPYAHQNHN